jgi:hypothetical protein
MTTAAQTSKIMSNSTAVVLMPLSGIMQIKEVGGTVIRSMKNWEHFRGLMKEIVNVYKMRGSDDSVTAMAMELDARGSSIIGNKLNQRAFDEGLDHLIANDETLIAQAHKASMSARDYAMLVYGIAPLTDIAQRMNARMNLDFIARVANGKARMSKFDMNRFGITQEMLDKVKASLKLNKNNNLHKDAADMFEKDKSGIFDDLKRVMFNMGQTQMVTPMQGTTINMFSESALGASLGTLMSFAFNSYATYGSRMVRGTMEGDIMSFMDNFMWFASMYIAQELKDTAKGKERSEEDKVRMALIMMPLAAPIALTGMIGGPAIQQATAEQIFSLTKGLGAE